MIRIGIHALELIGVGGLVALFAFIPLTKLGLGGALAILGAFFPNFHSEKNKSGTAQVKFLAFLFKMSGGLRFAVVTAGIIVLIGAVIDGHENYVKSPPSNGLLETKLRRDQLSREQWDALEAIFRKEPASDSKEANQPPLSNDTSKR